MSHLLLDTHAFIWWIDGNPKLGKAAIKAISDTTVKVYVSVASIWEMAIKIRSGKLQGRPDITNTVVSAGFSILAIKPHHAEQSANLPLHHKDPFDRMLIAQALEENLILVTCDQKIYLYDVKLIDALK